MAGIADVAKYCCPTRVAGIIDNEIAEAEYSLRDTGGNGYILNLAQRNVSRDSCYQAGIDLNFRVGQSVTNHVSPDVVVSRNQEQ